MLLPVGAEPGVLPEGPGDAAQPAQPVLVPQLPALGRAGSTTSSTWAASPRTGWRSPDYLQWVAPVAGPGADRATAGGAWRSTPDATPTATVTGWLVRLADGDTIHCRDLVIGAGRDPYVPERFDGLPPDRVIHSTQYRPRIAELARGPPLPGRGRRRRAERGGDVLRPLHEDLPHAEVTMVMRSIGLQHVRDAASSPTSCSTRRSSTSSTTPRPRPASRCSREMHRTNYAGLAPGAAREPLPTALPRPADRAPSASESSP